MAIAFRAAGARLKADIGLSGPNQSVALPAGHVSGDYLLLFVLTDDNTNTAADPAGWTRLAYLTTTGVAKQTPYNAPPRLKVYTRVDNGSLGSTVALTFSTALWPAGSPWVIAFTVAYSGTDTAAPLERWDWISTTSTAGAQAAPALTTANASDWLLTFRASSAFAAATFTDSVGTDAERVDDTDGFNELSLALYDSNAALTAGAQTVRTTTASRPADYGSISVSLALKPPAAAGSTTAAPGSAGVTATAYAPAVVTQDGPWALCDASGLPRYQFAIDWDSLPGPLNSNPDFEDAGGWTAYNGAAFARSQTRAHRGVWSGLMTTGAGGGPHIESDKTPVTAGRLYRASGWVWAESAFPAGVGFSVNFYDAGGGYLTTFSNFFVPPVGAWQYADGFFPAPAGAAQAGILLDTSGTPGAGLRIWGDEIRLDDWSALADPALVVGQGEDVTDDIVSDISISYGRDQERQLAPAAVGTAAFTLNNVSRQYSPENTDSPLYGDLDPARVMRALVMWNGQTYPLFRGRIDDFDVKADFSDRRLNLTFLDGMSDLAGSTLSTGIYASQRTGTLVNVVLDEAGWTGGRDIDPGATVVKYWWADGTDALSAVSDLVKSEGPPAIAYVAPDGTFVFRDRHHRLLRQRSRTAQATFHAGELGDCTASGVPQGALSLARPFSYAHGLKDIINKVTFDVPDRAPTAGLQQVWQDESTYVLTLGQSLDLTVSSGDPFMNAVTPVVGTDITASGPGVLSVLLSRTSGASAKLTLQAIGGTVTVTSVQVRAQLLAVQQTVRVSMQDPGSVTRHGERTYPNDAPWAGVQDAQAIANGVLLHYAQRLPTVQIRLVSSDPAHLAQVLARTVSDRVHITNDEMRLDADFFVERVQHAVQRVGVTGRPPVHSVTLGCERDLDTTTNPFAFDVRGSGFDQGVFDPLVADNAAQVFVFDDVVQGRFDTGEFGT
jgi:hypothetical protein